MLQGFLVALVAALVYMESRIGGQHMIDRPIIIGPLVGFIMGDPVTGLIIGGELELVWMGLVGIGTSTPPDVVIGSALATALAIRTGATYETTLALAIPISLLAQVGSIGVCILNTAFAHRADACAEKGDYRGVEISNWMGSALYFVFKFSMVFLGFLIGSDLITAIVARIPEVIQSGLGQSGNLLPALGIAMLIQMTWDRKFGAFLFLGFALAAFLNVSTIGAAVFGVVIAVLYYMLSGSFGQMGMANSDESEEL
ncbi:MAG: PTS sugar transporter subunit IIC [Enterocloster asparagiformis]|nr:PTS sugar transporter subunit IIC [Enterocloster asparagiformis]